MYPSHYLREPQSGYTLERPKPLVSGRHRKLVTFVASRKNNVSIGCETLLEADFCIHLEYRAAIINYQSQPFTIRFTGTSIRYTPDFLATLVDGSQVAYEVKSCAGGRDSKWQARRGMLEELFSRNGLVFEYVEENQFCQPVIMQNLRTLYHYGYGGKLARVPHILRLLRQQPQQSAPLETLLELGVSQADLTCALFHQRLFCNLLRPINTRSQVWCVQ